MKTLIIKYRYIFLIVGLLGFSSCMDELTELNQNPNGIDPATANPNLIMPNVLGSAAQRYLSLGFGDIAGVMQHTQKDGWFSGHNHYDWNSQDWTGWFGVLRNNNLMLERAEELEWTFHQGVALTMKSFIFGVITDLWGDAPYTNALQGDNGGVDLEYPTFDNQEAIYNGIISDLQKAAGFFATGDQTGIISNNDLYYGGDVTAWHKFANSLLLRYYMRISEKNPSVAQSGIEQIVSSGVYFTSAEDDATLAYTGGASDLWPSNYASEAGSNFRRLKPCQTLIDQLLGTEDPRLSVWIDPVHCQWVADESLSTEVDEFIRKNGEIQTGIVALLDEEYFALRGNGDVYTRHYNPTLTTADLNEALYVGLPAGLRQPSSYNLNPTPGQSVENQGVSQLSAMYRQTGGDLLQARLISSAEVSFILAEAAVKGWSVGGDAATHYSNGIKNSLDAWGVGDSYDDFIAQPSVAPDGTLAQILQQKWVASWTAATEAWFDYRRTGMPDLQAGPAALEPVLPVRFNYGNDELVNNESNALNAVDRLEITDYSGARGKDSQWSKMWLLQGTNKPW